MRSHLCKVAVISENTVLTVELRQSMVKKGIFLTEQTIFLMLQDYKKEKLLC